MLVGPQLVLSRTLTWLQPVKLLQLSMVQALLSSQLKGTGAQTPPAQVSGPVHALPSLHGLLFAVCEQPVTGEQLSSVQAFKSLQLSAAPGVQTPALQTSAVVHTLPSASHNTPLAAPPLKTQAPVSVLQLSAVQGLLSLHTVNAPLTQAPTLQTSPVVQALPSLQPVEFATCVQPNVASQASLVQALPSSQFKAAPALQFTPLHTSGLVQTLLSALQGPPGLIAVKAHAPVAGVQVFVLQTVLPAAPHTTTVAGLTLQL